MPVISAHFPCNHFSVTNLVLNSIMSKHLKALERVCAVPTPSDITWDELRKVLSSLGFEERKGGGSRRKFVHSTKKLQINLHQPHPGSIVAKVYVVQVVETLRESGLIK